MYRFNLKNDAALYEKPFNKECFLSNGKSLINQILFCFSAFNTFFILLFNLLGICRYVTTNHL